jgi:hypothetical protein|tara:strand:- start:360 stop:1334 length:975 start_codon:yes stop_codon:yes gene_type:complete
MGYVAGETIQDDEFNAFVNNSSSPFGWNHFAGTGLTVYGLGQTHLATVGAGDTVTASQWNGLLTAMDNVGNHTNDSLTARTQVTTGDSIAIKAAVAADLASLAAEVAGGSASASALTTSSAKQASSSSSAWSQSHVVEHSVTFANANTMRWFFNGGGKIRVLGDRTGNGATGGGATSKDTDWTTLLAAVGNFDIGSLATTRSGSGETLTTNGLSNGFHDLGTGYTVIIKLTADTSPYTANYIQISAKINAAVGSAVTITVKYELIDGSADNTYTSGNTSGVDVTPDRVGVTRVQTFVISPNSTQGLSANITESATAAVSNTTVT